MRPCPTCRTLSIDEDDRFCSLCGASVAPDARARTLTEFDVEVTARRDQKRSNRLLTVLSVVGALTGLPFVVNPGAPWWIRLPLAAILVLALATWITGRHGKPDARLERARWLGVRFLATVGALVLSLYALAFGGLILMFVVCSSMAVK